MKKATFYLLLLISSLSSFAQRITITTGGGGELSTRPTRAMDAGINSIRLITEDRFGNVFFYDSADRRIFKIDKFGIVSNYGGGGASISEGIPATSTVFSSVSSICTNSNGDLLLSLNYGIRKIQAGTGLIYTVAGSLSTGGFSGDGGPATAARFNIISKICSDLSDNIYVCDKYNYRIRKINGSTGYISTYAGDGTSSFSTSGLGGAATATPIGAPSLITTNSAGDLYLYTYSNILKVDHSTSNITRVLGGGTTSADCPATMCSVRWVTDMCVHDSDELCFTESNSCRWFKRLTDSVFYYSGNEASGFVDDTNSLSALQSNNVGVCSGNKQHTYIADASNHRIRKVIHATNRPVFAFGNYRMIGVCRRDRHALNIDLAVTDTDSAQTETWSVVRGANHGTLGGFPATASSLGKFKTTKPSNVYYQADSGYVGFDTFYVRVYDSSFADTMMLVVDSSFYNVMPTIVVADSLCANDRRDSIAIRISSGTSGTWSSSTGHLSILSTSECNPNYIRVNSAGDDTITAMLTGCPMQITKIVHIISPPVVSSIIGADTVCPHSTVTYTDSTFGGRWISLRSASSYPYRGSIDSIRGTYTSYTGASGYDTIGYRYSLRPCTVIATKRIFVNSAVHPISFPNMCIGSTDTITAVIASGSSLSFSHPRATLVSTSTTGFRASADSIGIDTLFYINSNSCGADTARAIFRIDSIVSPGIITGPSEICVYGYGDFYSSVAGGIWSVSNSHAYVSASGTVNGASVGADSVIYTKVNGACSSEVRQVVQIIDSLVNPGVVIGEDSICLGATTTFTDTAIGGYWSVATSSGTITSAGVFTSGSYGRVPVYYSITNTCGISTATGFVFVDTLISVRSIIGRTNACIGISSVYSCVTGSGIWSVSNAHATINSAGSLVGVSSGMDTVIYTVSNVCGSDSTTFAVRIDSGLRAGPIIGADSLCMGTFGFYHGADTGGFWHTFLGNAGFDSLGYLNGLHAGPDTIIYTVTNVCGADTAYKSIFVNQPPNTGVIVGVETVCVDSTITLTNSVPGGIWSVANGNATISGVGVVRGVSAGIDTVYYSLTNTCGTNHSKQNMLVTNCYPAGVEIVSKGNIDIFPNPASSILNIKVPFEGEVKIEMTDVTGRNIQIEGAKVGAQLYQINMGALAPGIYAIKVKSDTSVVTARVVLEK